jgi:hypothetical protein
MQVVPPSLRLVRWTCFSLDGSNISEQPMVEGSVEVAPFSSITCVAEFGLANGTAAAR